MTDPKQAVVDAALAHVAFDGWSDATLSAAARDAGVDSATARALFPRGGVDLALAYHRAGDADMVARLAREPLADMRFRDRVALAVRLRLEGAEKEAVRRGSTLFALPNHAADGARALWDTADHIWTALGDASRDVNWYTKRATLSGVYGSTVLFWLGDDSPGHEATWAFLDRRIDDVMKIEQVKAAVNKNPLLKPFMALPNWALSHVKAPSKLPRVDLPGSWNSPR
ncbi:COQ9 family protein [Oceaniglobus trochenteri]|uniref:COQ9 family protein n=1 Tax=Oceaniglobus trochenteri TaxID=2763260 RepID=UPI001CFF921C|nr:COQ9 family protein [Oceaniglobus trochenteri]